MSINLFKQHLEEKRAVKVIAGIDNFDIERVKKVAAAADRAGASALDICADVSIVSAVREMTDLPLFVSSVKPEELVRAAELGADAVELGNFDALYKHGTSFSAAQVLELAVEVKEMLRSAQHDEIFFCVTVPGEIPVTEQIWLARELETLGVDLIQTEGHYAPAAGAAGVGLRQQDEQGSAFSGLRGLMERAQLTISNTMELCANVEMPVMSATGINPTTAPFAFTAGASAVGIGSCVNKLDNEILMTAVINQVIDIASKNAKLIYSMI